MTNETEIVDAMCVDVFTGQTEWTKRAGTREAIHRDGSVFDPLTWEFCPHEQINSRG